MDKKAHWENIYTNKTLQEVSWYQPTPETSLDLIHTIGLDKSAAIIDIGGGDSFLVDHLLKNGYTDITVLDISEAAIQRAKQRLGDNANKVTWLVSDVLNFTPTRQYDVWHDRAAFHFLTAQEDIEKYKSVVSKSLCPFGSFVLGTFSENGPTKCSGIDITQYSQQSMTQLFTSDFVKVECLNVDHATPFKTTQNFTFCRFKRKS